MGRKGNSITLQISDEEKAALEDLALKNGCLHGNQPNISRLVRAIAAGSIKIKGTKRTQIVTAIEAVEKALLAVGQALKTLKNLV